MNCEDCGAETTTEGLCDGCTVIRVKQARVTAVKNANFLLGWALKNNHGPGEALLSLMVTFLLIHEMSAEICRSPIDIWVARAHAVLMAKDPQPQD